MQLANVQSVVLRATALYAFGRVINHVYSNWDATGPWYDPVWKNYTATVKSMPNLPTLANSTATSSTANQGAKADFYQSDLPRDTFTFALLVVPLYYWNLLLEDHFPARPQGAEEKSTEKAQVSDRGEPLTKKPLEQRVVKGKAQKPSISKRNTLLKWVLDMVFGTIWYSCLNEIIHSFIFRDIEERDFIFMASEKPQMTISYLLKCIISDWTGDAFCLTYVASLIGFIAMPAPQRPVFRTGTNALVAVFITGLHRFVFVNVIKSQPFQAYVISQTEALWVSMQANEGGRRLHLMDEL